MKHLAAILLFYFLVNSNLQGQTAPDVVLTDINGSNHDLHALLEDGKIVILAFFSTQNATSLAYHTSNSLPYLYASHGPDGDDKVAILYVEGDPGTPDECISGNCPGSNNLNWKAGVDFPIISNPQFAASLGVNSYPTIYIICPDKKMTIVPSLSANLLWEKAQNCPVAFGTYNVGIFEFTVGTPYREVCNVLTIAPSFRLTNLGDATLTQSTIKVKWNGIEMNQIQWSGFLQKFEYEEISAGNIAVTDGGQLSVAVSIPDHQDQFLANNEVITSFTPAKIFTYDTLLLKVRTDEFGYETYWEFRDEFDNVLQKGGNSFVGPNGGGVIISPNWQAPGTYPKNSTILKELVVPQNGCYSFHIVDAFGDGLTCSNCGGSSSSSGYYKIYNKNNPFNPLISGSAFTSYSRHYFKVSSSVLSDDEPEAAGHLELYPNPVSATLNVQFNANRGQQFKMEVFNALGVPVHQTDEHNIPSGPNTWTIPVENWPSGTYNLIISGETGRSAKQFIHIR